MVRPEKIIKIPSATFDTNIPWGKYEEEIPEDESENDWYAMLDRASYDKERWTISRTRISSVEAKELKNRRLEILNGVSDYDFNISGQYPRDIPGRKVQGDTIGNMCRSAR